MLAVRDAVPFFTYPAFAQAWDQAVERVLQAPSYLAAVGEWRSCMARAGYSVRDLNSGMEAAQARAAATQDSAAGKRAEVAVAVADVDCLLSSVLPVSQALDRHEMAALVVQFPQYAARAQSLGF